MKSNHGKEAEEVSRLILRVIAKRILVRDSEWKIILTGDFNANAIKN
jgi:hypothetical protein